MTFQFPQRFEHISDIHVSQYLTRQQLASNRRLLDPQWDAEGKKEALTRKGIRLFIQRVCNALKLNFWVEDDALVLVERFFARRSYERNDRYLVCGAAVFLAAKAKDSTRSVKHVAHALFLVRNANKKEELAALERNMDKKLAEVGLVDALLDAERALLYTLSFNVGDYHIQLALKNYLTAAQVYTLAPPPAHPVEGPPLNTMPMEHQKVLTQVALTFAKNIYKTQLVCQLPPETAAAACVRLAAERSRIAFNAPTDAMMGNLLTLNTLFKLTDSQYESFKDQIMELFVEAKPAAAPAAGAQPQQQQQQQATVPEQAAAGAEAGPAQQQQLGHDAIAKPPAPASNGAARGLANAGSPGDNTRSANDDQNNNNNSTDEVMAAESAGTGHAASLAPGDVPPQGPSNGTLSTGTGAAPATAAADAGPSQPQPLSGRKRSSGSPLYTGRSHEERETKAARVAEPGLSNGNGAAASSGATSAQAVERSEPAPAAADCTPSQAQLPSGSGPASEPQQVNGYTQQYAGRKRSTGSPLHTGASHDERETKAVRVS